MTVGETTEEIEWLGGDLEVKKQSTLSATVKTITLMLSICSITFGLYIVLAGLGGNS